MQITEEITEMGVTERRFQLEVDGEQVPGILWLPEHAKGPRPLVLQGHGGTQHKRVANILSLARRLVRHQGYAVAAIDAPGHGDRMRAEDREANRARRSAGGRRPPITEEQRQLMAARGKRVTKEWQATLDMLQELDEIGRSGPVGYWGVSMGTAFGIPFVAAEPRINCAILGLAALSMGREALGETAKKIEIPLLFMNQLDDELMTTESAVALFGAFGAKEKSMHINPGGHMGIPRIEVEYYETFYVRHLGTAKSEHLEASPSES
jgi:cephalosporin-C deacetylase-like acetyl esterase